MLSLGVFVEEMKINDFWRLILKKGGSESRELVLRN